ncbi:MAG: histidinol dehydrogenase [Bacteroidetes bacterium]|nr:histidinol dehydrogenase [Bacteroidota bacterium]
MKKLSLKSLEGAEYNNLLKRPSIDSENSFSIVKPILRSIKNNGMAAVLQYCEQFDNLSGRDLLVSKEEMESAAAELPSKVKEAIDTAVRNITTFHEQQIPKGYSLETMPGVECSREYRAIESVGLYIPGGTAVLPSTMMMLAIPARLAGCKRIVACSPAKNGAVNSAVLYAAGVCGVDEIYLAGGAQAIGMMAYGTEITAKVDKIFGPGNQYVTAAKSLVSIDTEGCAIDMPAGPSEVLIIADESADPSFVAADLLSQAEHGVDSQSILLTTSESLADKVIAEVDSQLKELERVDIAAESLKSSFILITNSLDECYAFSNKYAPEHLIINTANPEVVNEKIINAGSVFLGAYSPESVGDYASGTNHSLPTYGYAKSFSGVNVLDFMKSITFQKLTEKGLQEIAGTVITLAETEKLQGHANAVRVRLK